MNIIIFKNEFMRIIFTDVFHKKQGIIEEKLFSENDLTYNHYLTLGV